MRLLVSLLALTVFVSTAAAAPVGTAFTFQGYLQKNGLQYQGPADLELKLFDAASSGTQVGGTITRLAEPVTQGLFTLSLDFGAVFDGNARWLEVGVKTAGDLGYSTLGTRIAVQPTPYALNAPGTALALPFIASQANTGQSTTNDALDYSTLLGVTNTATTGVSHGLVGVTASSWQNSAGVVGVGSAPNGFTSGVQGYATASASGTGVVGVGNATGGYFRAAGANGTGLVGVAGANGIGGYFAAGGSAIAIKADGLAQVKTLQILGGADLAERFPVREGASPGMVLVIDPSEPGRLMVSREAYAGTVAGVVSGANDLCAGIELSNGAELKGTVPVALSGRVWVRADAREHPIHAGDLLTTSPLEGHCMAASDAARAPGTLLGKAMSALEDGTGMVLVLVSLR